MTAPAPALCYHLLKSAATAYGMKIEVAYSSTRTEPAIRARWATWLELKRRGYSCVGIGRVFGRDHGTILNGWKQTDALLATDPKFFDLCQLLTTIDQ